MSTKARAAHKLGTQYPELFQALAAPFEPDEVKKLPNSAGSKAGIQYVTARTCMNRLDTVLGNERWTEEYLQSANSVICRLTITLPDGSTLTKSDAGGFAGMKDQDNNVKSGFSDAFKRACYKLGVARYLYRDGIPYYDADVSRYDEPDSEPEHSTRETEPQRESVHGRARIQEKEAEPEPIRTQSESEGQEVKVEAEWDQSFWVHLTNEVARRNVAFQADHPEIEEGPLLPNEAVMSLVWLTWEAGLHPMSPTENPDTNLGKWVGVLEAIGKKSPKHRQRLETRLKEYMDQELRLKAESLKSPQKRGPR